jgi:hypothetical protein
MRLPRMTTQRWMIAVAVVAIIMTTVGIRRRQNEFLQLAAYHKKEWSHIVGRVSDDGVTWLRYDPLKRDWRLSSASESVYHAQMREKYEHAARYPWLPVAPDPPPPE